VIIGASGGVGSFAVQIAKASGAEVTGVCSTGKMTLLRAIGADHIIDYTRDDVVDGVHRYDVILDIAGNRPVSDLRRALTPDGTLVIVGGETDGRWLGGTHRQIGAIVLSPFVSQRLGTFISSENAADLVALRELIEAGCREAGDRPELSAQRRRSCHPLPRRRPRPREGRHHRLRHTRQPEHRLDRISVLRTRCTLCFYASWLEVSEVR